MLEPHFDAVRDSFVLYSPVAGKRLSKLAHTKLLVRPEVHDTPRHFARCRDDGMLIEVAPQAVDLPLNKLAAVLAHEFGHAADFAYPACWLPTDSGMRWIGEDNDQIGNRWRRLWAQRSGSQIERSADAIAEVVVGRPIRYSGSCLVQTFGRGVTRPSDLV